MRSSYEAKDCDVYRIDNFTGEQDLIARCDRAGEAAALLNKAWRLNIARKYTESARTFHTVECLPGFAWVGNFAKVK